MLVGGTGVFVAVGGIRVFVAVGGIGVFVAVGGTGVFVRVTVRVTVGLFVFVGRGVRVGFGANANIEVAVGTASIATKITNNATIFALVENFISTPQSLESLTVLHRQRASYPSYANALPR